MAPKAQLAAPQVPVIPAKSLRVPRPCAFFLAQGRGNHEPRPPLSVFVIPAGNPLFESPQRLTIVTAITDRKSEPVTIGEPHCARGALFQSTMSLRNI
jgi:hypothetical protein